MNILSKGLGATSTLVALICCGLFLVSNAWATPMTAGLQPHQPISDQKRVLVLLDDPALKNTSSKFFDALGVDHKVKFKKLSDGATVVVKTSGEFDYDNVIIMLSEKTNPSDKSLYNLLEFIDGGGNVLLTTNGLSKWAKDFAFENGIKFGDAEVKDRFPPSMGDVLAVPWPADKLNFVGKPTKENSLVFYSGISTEPSTEALQFGAVRLLSATLTSYQPRNAVLGSKIGLITAVEMRNNARVTVSGSIKQFDDEFAVSNREFNLRISKWTFAEASVLRVKAWSHSRVDGSSPERQVKHARHLESNLPRSHFPNPEWGPDARIYRIRDEVEYKMNIEVLNFDGQWKPFVADDVQLEFAMLDPYQRRSLKSDGKGNFNTVFMLPDQYGTFAFRVVYNRPGLSRLRLLDSVNVRPFRHDEYERFILSAFPYYSAVGAVMIAFLVFSISFVVARKPHTKTE